MLVQTNGESLKRQMAIIGRLRPSDGGSLIPLQRDVMYDRLHDTIPTQQVEVKHNTILCILKPPPDTTVGETLWRAMIWFKRWHRSMGVDHNQGFCLSS